MKTDFFSPLLDFKKPLIGLDISAFHRVVPGLIKKDYQLIGMKDAAENDLIASKMKIFSTERDFTKKGERAGKYNTLTIIKNARVQRYLNSFATKPYLVLYRSTESIEKICDKFGWQILANRASTRDLYENKDFFRSLLHKVKLETVPGEKLKINELNKEKLVTFLNKWKEVVLILPELTKGGGHSLVFVRKLADFDKFKKKITNWSSKFDLRHVIVTKYINAFSPSITGCVTRFGILTGPVQTQILDQPSIVNLSKGSGLFCGHDWSFKIYSDKIQKQAELIAGKIGQYMWKHGYRGIFGIDLLIDKKTEKVYACECNPRYTGAFPIYSMLQMEQEEPAFDVFHLLELLKLDYQMDFETINNLYKKPKRGSHLVLSNLSHDYQLVTKDVKPGVYRFNKNKLNFVRPGFTTFDIHDSEDEFLLTDGLSRKGQIVRPILRIGKLVFKKGVLEKNNSAKLTSPVRKIIKLVYKNFGLKKIK